MTDTSKDAVDRLVLAMIRSGNTTAANMLNALAVERDAANARADAARDAALVEAETEIRRIPYGWYDGINAEYHHISAAQMRMDAIYAILALRDKPAPGVTVQDAGFCPSNDLISISEEEL